MYTVGDKIMYGEQGACVVLEVGHVAIQGIAKDRVFYTLQPISGGSTIYAPVDSPVFTRYIMSRAEAEAFLAKVPLIAPAVCTETKVTRADAYYKSVFSSHSNEALVAMLKGISPDGPACGRRNTLNLRLERVVRRAKDLLLSELAASLEISTDEAQKLFLAAFLTK